MTLDELLVEGRLAELRRLDTTRLKYKVEARAAHAGGTRRAIAAALVRLGARLDRGALERVAPVIRTDPQLPRSEARAS